VRHNGTSAADTASAVKYHAASARAPAGKGKKLFDAPTGA
jgi:hypothetical protein